MKLPRKLLALVLAGVMMLTLLTGCGEKSKSQTVAENLADYFNTIRAAQSLASIKFTYSVPELSQIKSQLAPEWFINSSTSTSSNYVQSDAIVSNNTTVRAFVQNALEKYESTDNYAVLFSAVKLPKVAGPFTFSMIMLEDSFLHLFGADASASEDNFDAALADSNVTRGKIGVDFKTIGDDTYCLAVIILEK